MTDRRTNLIA